MKLKIEGIFKKEYFIVYKDRSFVRGHYNTDLQEYNEKQCEKMSGFPVISDCGYGADMVV